MASRVSADPWAMNLKGSLIPDTADFEAYVHDLQTDPDKLDAVRQQVAAIGGDPNLTPGQLATWGWRNDQLQAHPEQGTDPVIGLWQSQVDSGQLQGKDLPAPYGLDENGKVTAVPTGMKKDPATGQLIDQNVFMKHPWLIAPAALGAGLGAAALTGGIGAAGAAGDLASTSSAGIGTLPVGASSGAVDAAFGGSGGAFAAGAPALASGVTVPTTAEGVSALAAQAPAADSVAGLSGTAGDLTGTAGGTFSSGVTAATDPLAGLSAAQLEEMGITGSSALYGADLASSKFGPAAVTLAKGQPSGTSESLIGDAAGAGGVVSTLKGLFGDNWAKLLLGAGLTGLGDYLGKPQQRKSFAGTDADPVKLLSGAMGQIGNLSTGLKKQIQSGPQLTAYAQPVKGLDAVDPAYTDRSLLKYPGTDLGLDLSSAGKAANDISSKSSSDTSATGSQTASRNQPDSNAIQSTSANTGYLDTSTDQGADGTALKNGTVSRVKFNATGNPTATAASSLGLTPQQQAAIQLVKSTQQPGVTA